MGRRGQVSVEYTMIIGFSLLILVPIILVSMQSNDSYQGQIEEAQLQRAALEITQTADIVHFEGAPARRTLRIYLPDGIESARTDGQYMIFNVTAEGREIQVFAKATHANLTWNVTGLAGGYKTLVIEAQDESVIIGDAP